MAANFSAIITGHLWGWGGIEKVARVRENQIFVFVYTCVDSRQSSSDRRQWRCPKYCYTHFVCVIKNYVHGCHKDRSSWGTFLLETNLCMYPQHTPALADIFNTNFDPIWGRACSASYRHCLTPWPINPRTTQKKIPPNFSVVYTWKLNASNRYTATTMWYIVDNQLNQNSSGIIYAVRASNNSIKWKFGVTNK